MDGGGRGMMRSAHDHVVAERVQYLRSLLLG